MPGQSVDFGSKTLLAEVPPRGAQFLQKIESTRQEMRRFLWMRGLLRVVLLALAGLGLIGLADWLLVLGTTVRAAGLVLLAIASLVFFYRWVIAARRCFDRQKAAGEVESMYPDLGQRVCTALEYMEPTPETAPALPMLVDALTRETDRQTSCLHLQKIIPWRSLAWIGTALGAVVALYFLLGSSYSEARVAGKRVLLIPAQYTELDVKPGDQTLKAGEDLAIEATLSGRPVRTAHVLHRPLGSKNEWIRCSFVDEQDVRATRLSGILQTKLSDLQNDLEYKIVAGPVESSVYHVKVNRPLVLQKLEAAITPPAYTRRKPSLVQEGNFEVIEGSRVQFRFTLDRTPQDARIRFVVTDRDKKAEAEAALPRPLKIEGKDLVCELQSVDKSLDYELLAEAADGLHLEGARFHIRVLADRKPVVRFVKPKEQIEVTPTTEVHLKVEAGDDFGLSKIGIVYQVSDGPPQTLYLQDQVDQPTSLKTEAILSLENHDLHFTDSVTYYAFVEDNHPIHPQRTSTELQFIDIRPFKRTYQILDGGGT
jgi:Domain of unknown function (DUF4175)